MIKLKDSHFTDMYIKLNLHYYGSHISYNCLQLWHPIMTDLCDINKLHTKCCTSRSIWTGSNWGRATGRNAARIQCYRPSAAPETNGKVPSARCFVQFSVPVCSVLCLCAIALTGEFVLVQLWMAQKKKKKWRKPHAGTSVWFSCVLHALFFAPFITMNNLCKFERLW